MMPAPPPQRSHRLWGLAALGIALSLGRFPPAAVRLRELALEPGRSIHGVVKAQSLRRMR